MADRVLLESGAPDGYLLEDGSGVLLKDISTYYDTVIADNPIAYFRLSEASGSFTDEIAGGSSAPVTGTAIRGVAGALSGDPNLAVNFNSVAYATAPDQAKWDVGDVISIEAWVNFAASGAAAQSYISRTDAGGVGTAGDWVTEWDRTLQKVKFFRAPWTNICETTGVTISAGVWWHLVYTKNGTTQKWYVNGIDRTNVITTGVLANSANAVYIGSFGANAELSDSVDEVAIYGTTLPADRVLAHYSAGVGQMTHRTLVAQAVNRAATR